MSRPRGERPQKYCQVKGCGQPLRGKHSREQGICGMCARAKRAVRRNERTRSTRRISAAVLTVAMTMSAFLAAVPAPKAAASTPALYQFWLHYGWNLWSCPFEDSTFTRSGDIQYPFTAKGFLDAFPAVLAISRLDTTSHSWRSYVHGYGDAYDFALSTDQGYFVWMHNRVYNDVRMTCGPRDTNPTPLASGWNIVSDKITASTESLEIANLENMLAHTPGSRAAATLDVFGSGKWYGYLNGWVYEHIAYVDSMGWGFYLFGFDAVYVWADYPTHIVWTGWEPLQGVSIG